MKILEDPRVLDEVQSAMSTNSNLLGNTKEWMTPDLLNQIAQNPKLFKLFANQEYMQV